jgi:hypothetical protein
VGSGRDREGSRRPRLSWRPSGILASGPSLLWAFWGVALVVAATSAQANPVVRMADAAQYGQPTLPVQMCFADITGPRPSCPYVKPALTGMTLPIPARRDPGQLAADGLSMDDEGIIATAKRLISTQRDGTWVYVDSVRLADSTLRAPWTSASAQGLGASVLARAWSISSDDRYRAALVSAVLAMPVSADGWPESLPDDSHALTGGLNGLLGLWDAWRVTRDPAIGARFERGVAWLEANIGRYDRDFIVLYALGPHDEPTSRDLLDHSIAQLSVVAAASGRDSLAAVSREWEWRWKNPGAFRLNLYLHALAREPASKVVVALTAVLGLASALRRTRAIREVDSTVAWWKRAKTRRRAE